VHADDIQAVLTHITDPVKQAALIEYFLPEISYSDAIKLDLVTKNGARRVIIHSLQTLNPLLPAPTTIDAAGDFISPPPA